MSADYTRPGIEPWWEQPNPKQAAAEQYAASIGRQGVFAYAILRDGCWTVEMAA